MIAADKQAFAEVMNQVSAIYGKSASYAQIEMYFNVLSRFAFDEVKAGLQSHVANPDSGQFFPKPADVIRHLEGSGETQVEAAWSKVDRAVRCVGQYRDVVFDSWIIHRVIEDMGGWVKIAQSDADEYPFLANEFKRRFRGYIGKRAEFPRVLRGLASHQNRQRDPSFKLPAPTLIGDQSACLKIWQAGREGANTLINHDAKTVASLLADSTGKTRKSINPQGEH